MTEPVEKIEIEELREAGEDGGDLMGYFARGHHNPHDFAEAANAYSGAKSFHDRRHVNPKRVSQVWWRTSQMAGEPKGTYEYRHAQPGERGAWKATVCESVSDYSMRQVTGRIREFERGLADGLSRGVHFMLGALEYSFHSDPEERERRKKLAAELRQLWSQEEKSELETARKDARVA